MPLLLAYADDIVVISDSINSLDRVFSELISELVSVGLEVNESKCEVLIRDPGRDSEGVSDTLCLAGRNVRVVPVIKYLGIYISSDLSRRIGSNRDTRLSICFVRFCWKIVCNSRC